MKILLMLVYLFVLAANAEDTILLEKGDLLFEETFKGQKLDESIWVSTKTKTGFEVKGGSYLWDCSKSSDVRKRVSLKHQLKNEVGDLVLEFQFTPGPGFKSASVVFNDEYGHCLVTVLGSTLLETYKFPNTRKLIVDYADYPDACGARLKSGETYSVRVEIKGFSFFVYINDDYFLMGQNSRFSNPKNSLQFSFQGQTGKLTDIRLYQGIPKEKISWDEWSKKKESRLPIKDFAFLEKKKLSDTRQQLGGDVEYQKLISQIRQLAKEIKVSYPFFKSARKSDKKKHSEAMKNNSAYSSLLKKLKKLEKAELDFIASKIQDVKSIER